MTKLFVPRIWKQLKKRLKAMAGHDGISGLDISASNLSRKTGNDREEGGVMIAVDIT